MVILHALGQNNPTFLAASALFLKKELKYSNKRITISTSIQTTQWVGCTV
jgi:hypothetical protein